MSSNGAVGVIDSGIGGLTVARRIMEALPNEKIVYFGDTGNAPYGLKSRDEITEASLKIMQFITKMDVKLVVIACNTICANSFGEIRANSGIPVIEIISDAVAVMESRITGGGPAGVIATEATVISGAYLNALAKTDASRVIQKACPLFVTLAEAGVTESKAVDYLSEFYLRDFKKAGISALILGCTHFPLFEGSIRSFLGENVFVIDPALAAAETVKNHIRLNNAARTVNDPPRHEFYVSGPSPAFETVCKKLLGTPYTPKRVEI